MVEGWFSIRGCLLCGQWRERSCTLLLQRRMAPIWASLLLGVVWAVWHLPSFMLSSTPQSARALTPFLVATLALSVIVTPLFNHSQGSILLPAFFHLQLINPLWPDAQPYYTWLFVAFAAPVGVSCRRPGIHRVSPTVRQQDTPTGARFVHKQISLQSFGENPMHNVFVNDIRNMVEFG